jgi:AraC-like DNA-binding protein
MDVLTDVLRTLRLRGSLLFRCEQRAPWGLASDDADYATFHIVVAGQCWLRLIESQLLVPLASGDLVLLPQGTAHALSDTPDTPTKPFLSAARRQFRTLRGDGSGLATIFLCGAFQVEQQHHPLLALLPQLVHIPGAGGRPAPELAAILSVLEEESRTIRLGHEVVLQRLTDTLLVQIIRAWTAQQTPQGSGWLGALADAQIGPALELMHADPARAWSVAELASAVAMSRSAFSARFTARVGQSPLNYLKRWRMQLTAALLRNDDYALQKIAAHVGYESDAALSKAFKQEFGTAPGAYRQRVRNTERRMLNGDNVQHGTVTD